jgi:hypothetical protein
MWALLALWVPLTQMSSLSLLGLSGAHDVSIRWHDGCLSLVFHHPDDATHASSEAARPHRHAPSDEFVLAFATEPDHGPDHVVLVSGAERASLRGTSLGKIHGGLPLPGLLLDVGFGRAAVTVALEPPGPAPPPPFRSSPLLI